jgi:hypothetical protein
MKRLMLLAALALAGCGTGEIQGNSEAAIANQASALENAADATVNAQIEALNAEANASFTAQAPANNSSNATGASKK